MLKFPNAKINIGLFITEKRKDGYHNIETILFPIPFCDALEVIDNKDAFEDFELRLHGISIDGDPKDNLVYKAYRLLKQDFNLPKIRVELFKKIPPGSGLGGGSSDATEMLKLLNEKYELNIPEKRMESYARQIGSDCACFVKNKPLFAYEKGDVFENINLSLKGYQLILICPSIHINTKTAYQNITPQKAPFDLRKLSETPIENWKSVVKNDFEKNAFENEPALDKIKQKLYHLGADYASMSGSGSAMFGLFPIVCSDEKLKEIHQLLQSAFENYSAFAFDL